MIRVALTVGGIPFVDERVGGPTWATTKPEMPYKSLPVLVVDGKKYAQTPGIQRYVGKLAGLYPSDALQAMQVDEVLGALEDVVQSFFKYKSPDEKQHGRETAAKEAIPRYFGTVEKRISEWGSNGYTVGDSLTIADLAILCLMVDVRGGFYSYVPTDVFDTYPNAVALYDKLMAHPVIAKWFKDHPHSGSV